MNRRQRATLHVIFDDLVRANIEWADMETLFGALRAEIREGSGSRIRVALNGVRAVFHRPHPKKEAGRGAVRSVRDFLTAAGIVP